VAGVYGALLTVWYLMKETPMDGIVTVACNGRSVLDHLQSKKSIDPFAAHADLLQACKNIQKERAFNIQFVHVKGHQDNSNPTVLSHEAWLNIETDLLAKSQILENSETIGQELPFEPWRLVIDNKKIVKLHKRAIQTAMNGPAAKSYWKEKMPQVSQLQTELDGEAMERALKESTPGRRRWVTKHITGHFAHRKNMVQRGQRSTAQCPRCLAEMEDKIHILRCPATSARKQWTISIQKLSHWMKDQGIALEVQMEITLQLERWINNDTQQTDNQSFTENQQWIGWDGMMDGWLSRSWRDHQEKIWKCVKSLKSSLRWTMSLIKKLCKVSWDMWDH